MINQYPLWKYLLIAAILIAGAVYALPNLYGEDPALQVSATRAEQVDTTIRDRVVEALREAGIRHGKIELQNERLLVRFADTEAQLKAADKVQTVLGNRYVVALNLASAAPAWLQSISARPMYLGLDLRGGMHFLMEVDMEAAVTQAEERYVGEFRDFLRKREQPIRYITIARGDGGILAQFRSAADRDQALAALDKEYDKLEFSVGANVDKFLLTARIGEQQRREIRDFALQQNITTLRNRVNELGVAEPVIQQQGVNRVVVQLPGVQDTARAKEILGATATLEFRLVDEGHNPADAEASNRVPAGSELYHERSGAPVLLQRRVILTGDYITDASSGLEQDSGKAAVFINLDSKGGRIMGNATKDAIGKMMAVVFIENKVTTREVDGKPVKQKTQVKEVINIATIRDQLGNRFQITGLDSPTEARNLALLLRAGALAAPIEIIEERTVGPSLGAENIQRGFHSTWLGFALIAVFMIIYYVAFGVTAVLALGVNVVLLVALLSMLQATLTLPGMAAIALTVGMAIDANVLINERIREELRNGNTPQASIHAGYERAFGTILDSNITTLIAGFALFMFGSGSVRGFAVVLCLGILTSMFSGVMVSRALVNLLYGGRRVERLAIGNTRWN
ncbi:MAG: protein translocase subunit SecD [Gammaproteobacteria bacterium]|nr:protein translocase subunit SecD [Gammaproteobacteria bacterium]